MLPLAVFSFKCKIKKKNGLFLFCGSDPEEKHGGPFLFDLLPFGGGIAFCGGLIIACVFVHN